MSHQVPGRCKSKRPHWLSIERHICLTFSGATSDRFTATLKHRGLTHTGHALPAGAVEAGNHVDAHDLHELVFQSHGVNRSVVNISDRSNAAGTLIHGVGIDGLHGLIRCGAMASQVDELPGLLRRITDDAYTDRRFAICRGLIRSFGARSATHKYRGRSRRPENTHSCLQNVVPR